MELTLEVLVLFLNLGLAMAAIGLFRILTGSVFSNLPKYVLILALSLIVHASSDIFLSGQFGFLVYGSTAAIASLSFLLLAYDIFVILKNIEESR